MSLINHPSSEERNRSFLSWYKCFPPSKLKLKLNSIIIVVVVTTLKLASIQNEQVKLFFFNLKATHLIGKHESIARYSLAHVNFIFFSHSPIWIVIFSSFVCKRRQKWIENLKNMLFLFSSISFVILRNIFFRLLLFFVVVFSSIII